jgi:hypothetical protein
MLRGARTGRFSRVTSFTAARTQANAAQLRRQHRETAASSARSLAPSARVGGSTNVPTCPAPAISGFAGPAGFPNRAKRRWCASAACVVARTRWHQARPQKARRQRHSLGRTPRGLRAVVQQPPLSSASTNASEEVQSLRAIRAHITGLDIAAATRPASAVAPRRRQRQDRIGARTSASRPSAAAIRVRQRSPADRRLYPRRAERSEQRKRLAPKPGHRRAPARS